MQLGANSKWSSAAKKSTRKFYARRASPHPITMSNFLYRAIFLSHLLLILEYMKYIKYIPKNIFILKWIGCDQESCKVHGEKNPSLACSNSLVPFP